MRNVISGVVLSVSLSSLSHAAAVCPPPVPNHQPLCIKSGQVYSPQKGEMAAVSELFMEDNSTLRLDPAISANWDIKIGNATLGSNTIIDLSGHNATSTPPKQGPAQPQYNQCQRGYDGLTGNAGENGTDSASAVFTIQNLVTGSTYVIRSGGNGGVGGEGGTGSQGGNGNPRCGCNGAEGGYGGVGGRGGNAGDAKKVEIRFKSPSSGLAVFQVDNISISPGINDSPKSIGGIGGQPGLGGIGGHGGGHCFPGGDGASHDNLRAGNIGTGSNGKTEQFLLIPYH